MAARALGVSEAAVRRWRAAQDPTTKRAPRILLWDIESAPILGYTWGMHEQNVLHVVRDWKLLTIAWSWYGSGVYNVKQLCDFDRYEPGDLDDYEITAFVRELLNQADYSIAHNGDAFDVKKVNAKIAEHGLFPPSPHTQIDTLKVARRNMKVSSNRLDYLGNYLGVGRKVKHSGFDLWLKCMDGDPKAWKEMCRYARQDVVLLEQVFNRLRPWVTGINWKIYVGSEVCGGCGTQRESVDTAAYSTKTRRYRAWSCGSCGSWNKGGVIK